MRPAVMRRFWQKWRWPLVVVAHLCAGVALAAVPDNIFNPLYNIQRQINKVNIVVVLDDSGSMNDVPGASDDPEHQAGPDCDEGDAKCGDRGNLGRCYMSQGGRMGAGVKSGLNMLPCQNDNQCRVGYCADQPPDGCRSD